eukprot:1103961-Pleurochrysis_carterae.AAC.1
MVCNELASFLYFIDFMQGDEEGHDLSGLYVYTCTSREEFEVRRKGAIANTGCCCVLVPASGLWTF